MHPVPKAHILKTNSEYTQCLKHMSWKQSVNTRSTSLYTSKRGKSLCYESHYWRSHLLRISTIVNSRVPAGPLITSRTNQQCRVNLVAGAFPEWSNEMNKQKTYTIYKQKSWESTLVMYQRSSKHGKKFWQQYTIGIVAGTTWNHTYWTVTLRTMVVEISHLWCRKNTKKMVGINVFQKKSRKETVQILNLV